MSWLRTNRWGLAALVVLLPLVTWVSFSDGWRNARDNTPHREIVADAGATARFLDAQWRLAEVSRHTDNRGEPIPDGTEVVVVRVEIQPDDRAAQDELIGCQIKLTDGIRTWTEPALALLDWRRDPATALTCTGPEEPAETYEVERAFLVPAGAAVDGAVTVLKPTALPDYLSLRY